MAQQAGFAASELTVSSLPSPGVIAATSLTTAGSYNSIPLARAEGHSFARTLPTQRVYLLVNPERICVTASGTLLHYTNYAVNNSNPFFNDSASADKACSDVAAAVR